MYSVGKNISSEGKLDLLTSWFNQHKEGHRCYFESENCLRIEGYTIIRTFKKSKEKLREEFKELLTTRDNINSQIDKKLETKDLKDYFEFKDQLSSVNAKLDCLRREIC